MHRWRGRRVSRLLSRSCDVADFSVTAGAGVAAPTSLPPLAPPPPTPPLAQPGPRGPGPSQRPRHRVTHRTVRKPRRRRGVHSGAKGGGPRNEAPPAGVPSGRRPIPRTRAAPPLLAGPQGALLGVRRRPRRRGKTRDGEGEAGGGLNRRRVLGLGVGLPMHWTRKGTRSVTRVSPNQDELGVRVGLDRR